MGGAEQFLTIGGGALAGVAISGYGGACGCSHFEKLLALACTAILKNGRHPRVQSVKCRGALAG
jgi:hypothetical protein